MTVQHSLNLAANHGSPSFRRYLQQVSASVAAGQELAAALALDKRYFGGWTLSLIRLAEYSGALPEVFERLAKLAEQEQRRERLYRSLRISVWLAIWSLLVLGAVLFNPNPYGPLRLRFWLHGLGLGLLLFAVSILVSRYPGRSLQRIAAVIPGLDKVVQARSLLRFAELSLPLSCGVPFLTALDLVRDRVPDPVMVANLASAVRTIRTGQTLSSSLQGKFPPLALQMIRTGEETGNLDAAFQRLSEYYEGELERSLHQLQGIMRPLSILAIAGLVAVLAVRAISVLTQSFSG